jgi:hypothetical protein
MVAAPRLDAGSPDGRHRTSNSNLWGPSAPRSWVEEATPFAGVEIGGRGADSARMTLKSWLAARAGGDCVNRAEKGAGPHAR